VWQASCLFVNSLARERGSSRGFQHSHHPPSISDAMMLHVRCCCCCCCRCCCRRCCCGSAPEDNKMCITDLNSTNGTVVNGQELSPMDNIEVEVGSEVIFGEALLGCGLTCSKLVSDPASATFVESDDKGCRSSSSTSGDCSLGCSGLWVAGCVAATLQSPTCTSDAHT